MQYPGIWRRFGAYWIDVIAFLPLGALSLWMGETSRMFQVYFLVPGLLIGLWYHVHLVKQYGATPGKLLLKIKIVMVDGSPVGYRGAMVRYSVLFVFATLMNLALVSAVLQVSDQDYFSLGFIGRTSHLVSLTPSWYQPVGILMQIWLWGGLLTMLANKRRRAIHDFMAGTVVVRANPSNKLVE